MTLIHTASGEPVKVGDVLAHMVMGKNPRLENYRVYEIPRCSGALYCEGPNGTTREYRPNWFVGVAEGGVQ